MPDNFVAEVCRGERACATNSQKYPGYIYVGIKNENGDWIEGKYYKRDEVDVTAPKGTKCVCNMK